MSGQSAPSRIAALLLIGLAGASAEALAGAAPAAATSTVTLTSCSGYGDGGSDTDIAGSVWQGVGSASYSTSNRCPQGGSFQILPAKTPHQGDSVQWHTVTPPSLEIVHGLTPVNEVLIDPYSYSGDGFNASFFWSGGTQTIATEGSCCGGMDYGSGINRWLGPSRYFGWQVTCALSSCGAPYQILDVRGVELVAVDYATPNLLALGSNNLWYQGGRWVRGSGWPASFAASDDDGICGMQAIIDGQLIAGPSDSSPNPHSWTQCPDPQTMSLTVDTTQYANGPMSLTLSARDAASPANVSSPSESLGVDNEPVSLSLSGPTDARSTAGTQYVSATAAAGPSGVAGIDCAVDGGPYQWHPSSSAQIPVEGVGQHQVVCYALNHAIDVYGSAASSPTQTWSLSIREPTVVSAGFAKVLDPAKCRRRTKHVHVRGQLVKVHRHHKVVWVHRRGHWKNVSVVHCHPRLVWRKVRLHGHWRRVRVPLFPHVITKAIKHVGFGRRFTVSGWLGLGDGTALGAQTVRVYTAADDGLNRFVQQQGLAVTSRTGTWHAILPAGPSRLIVAVYGGSSTTEPTFSAAAHVLVPAKIKVRVSRRKVPWGGTVEITGRLLGGYIPADKTSVSQLLRLRIGIGGIHETVGIPDVDRSGRFRTTYRFFSGSGTVHYWFSVSSLRETDYPFSPSSSARVSVTVGG